MALEVKNPPVMQEDPLEEDMATHSLILAWRIPWTEDPGGLQSIGSQRVGHDWVTKHSTTQSLFILLNWNFMPLISNSPFPLLLVHGNHESTLILWIWLLHILHINENIQCLSFCEWLISPSIMPSGFVHIVPYCRISLFKVLKPLQDSHFNWG